MAMVFVNNFAKVIYLLILFNTNGICLMLFSIMTTFSLCPLCASMVAGCFVRVPRYTARSCSYDFSIAMVVYSIFVIFFITFSVSPPSYNTHTFHASTWTGCLNSPVTKSADFSFFIIPAHTLFAG